MLDNLCLPWEGVKINLGESGVEGRVRSSGAKRILCHSSRHFYAYLRLCHLDIFWGVELEKEWSLRVWCCLVGLFPSKAFPWMPGLVCNQPACFWLWALPDQCNNAWATLPTWWWKWAELLGDISVLVTQESLGLLCPSRNDSEGRIAKRLPGSLALFCLQTGWQTWEAEMNIWI